MYKNMRHYQTAEFQLAGRCPFCVAYVYEMAEKEELTECQVGQAKFWPKPPFLYLLKHIIQYSWNNFKTHGLKVKPKKVGEWRANKCL